MSALAPQIGDALPPTAGSAAHEGPINWETAYPPEAWRQIRAEGIYLACVLSFAVVVSVILLRINLDHHEAVQRFLICALGGIAGSWIYSMKWYVRAITHHLQTPAKTSNLVRVILLFHRSRVTRHVLLLHCFTHGSPTPRPAFSRGPRLARTDCPRHSGLPAFHGSASPRRPTLLDRNRRGQWRNDSSFACCGRSGYRHRAGSEARFQAGTSRERVSRAHRRLRRYPQERSARGRFRPPHPPLRQSSVLHHLADPASPLRLRVAHRRNALRHPD